MASPDLKHRKKREPEPDETKIAEKRTLAKQGLKSLSLAVSIPVSLTLFTIFLVRPRSYGPPATPFWFPSIAAVNLASLVSSFLMGLSAWFVWADGGLNARPTGLYLCGLYLALCSGWYTLVLGMGAGRVGLVTCLGQVGALVGCGRVFGGVNPVAADLVKPCLVWTAFLTLVTATLISL